MTLVFTGKGMLQGNRRNGQTRERDAKVPRKGGRQKDISISRPQVDRQRPLLTPLTGQSNGMETKHWPRLGAYSTMVDLLLSYHSQWAPVAVFQKCIGNQ